MNNSQFRRLFGDDARQAGDSTPSRTGGPASALGTKKSSFVPMTPRAVKGSGDNDFARQVRERNAALQPAKKFKSSAPKGSKFAAGYTDRAKARAEAGDEGEADQKAARINALEEQMKLGQISSEIFEALRDEITGGDITSTHLVKGLDRRLLERVRRGEDVMGSGNDTATPEPTMDVEEELEKLEEKQVAAVQKGKSEKKGTMAPPSLAGHKRSRDEIMAELKAQRKAAADAKAAADLQMGGRWRKVGDKGKSRIELDRKGRQVLITVDEDGVVKKKIRKVPVQGQDPHTSAIEMPDASKAVLGTDAVVPELATAPEPDAADNGGVVDDDDDIFEGVGADYDPLAGDDDASSDEDDTAETTTAAQSRAGGDENDRLDARVERHVEGEVSENPKAPRNYFNDKASAAEEATSQDHLARIQEVLKKAAKLAPRQSDQDGAGGDAATAEARRKRRAEMLANHDRDLEDMDLGFGGSRHDHGEEDEEGKKVRLAEWNGAADDGREEHDDKGDRKKKTRKPKKRKGDADSISDIMGVIERRRTGGKQ